MLNQSDDKNFSLSAVSSFPLRRSMPKKKRQVFTMAFNLSLRRSFLDSPLPVYH